jgi:hypothetical protein
MAVTSSSSAMRSKDFVPEMTVYEHSVNTRAELTANIQLISCSGPERRMIGGYDALQYEIEGYYQQTRIKYLHTTIAGRRAFHQVLAWATYLAIRPYGIRLACSQVSASCQSCTSQRR